jgi:hypothetical protein
MTRRVVPEIQTAATPASPPREEPQLDEALWQAWKEKNERRDKMRFARRVKVIAILGLILGVLALARFAG